MQFSRPVRLRMDLNTNMEMFGSKEPFKAVYRVRFNLFYPTQFYRQPLEERVSSIKMTGVLEVF